MPSLLVSIEIIIGALLLVVIFILAGTYLRRRYIADGKPMPLCAYRPDGGARWRMGLLKFGDTSLEWYSLGGFSLRPNQAWSRSALLIEAPRRISSDGGGLFPDGVQVEIRSETGTFELTVPQSAYTALRSWQEASPPGYNANVA